MLIVKIHNDGTGVGDIGNYDYEVLINNKAITSGRVENHIRSLGWLKLLQNIIQRETIKKEVI